MWKLLGKPELCMSGSQCNLDGLGLEKSMQLLKKGSGNYCVGSWARIFNTDVIKATL